ncbi:MAG TPA: tyrosine-type recombinase/integrase [Rariglobus sp.]
MKLLHRIDAPTLAKALARQHERARLADGGGLYLSIRTLGHPARWLFRYKVGGQQFYEGLGQLIAVPARVARAKAAALRVDVQRGDYPHLKRVALPSGGKSKAEPTPIGRTVAVAVAEFLEVRTPSKHPSHARQWEQTLADYIVMPLGTTMVRDLTRKQLIDALAAVWQESNETARRTLSRFRRVLDREIALGNLENNIGDLGPIQAALGRHRGKTKNHSSMPFTKVPAFLDAITRERTIAAEALRFLTLTAARTIEVRTVRWSHIDLEQRVWAVPAALSKTGRAHRVPLSKPALAILRDMRSIADDPDGLVFPGEAEDGRLSENTLLAVMARHGWKGRATPHGMRASFRTWAAKRDVKFEIAEECLSHLVGTPTQRAYERPDYFEERVPIMKAWADFICPAKVKLVRLTAS